MYGLGVEAASGGGDFLRQPTLDASFLPREEQIPLSWSSSPLQQDEYWYATMQNSESGDDLDLRVRGKMVVEWLGTREGRN